MAVEKRPRRERERLKRRNEIIKAAKWVFSRRGFVGASLDEIAERCELAKGTLYYYFSNKEELLFSVLEETINDAVASVESIDENAHSRMRIKTFLENLLTVFQRDYDIFNVLLRERRRINTSLLKDTPLKEKISGLQVKMQEIISVGIDKGEIKALNPVFLASSIIGMVQGLSHSKMFNRIIEHNPEKEAKFLTNIIFEGVKPS